MKSSIVAGIAHKFRELNSTMRKPPAEDEDCGPEAAIDAGLRWISAAQDHSASRDGGVAATYHMTKGWSASYPETTGYIVATVLEQAQQRSDAKLRERARRMVDWLCAIQRPDGAFNGGVVGSTPLTPVTFDTGQILLGLAAAVEELGDAYRDPLGSAASWLVDRQDSDGAWRVANPFIGVTSACTFETHTSWGLLAAARVTGNARYAEAAFRQIDWALAHQDENGWFAHCCLDDPHQPLTHTIGYVLRGVIEGHRFCPSDRLLDAGLRTAKSVLNAMRPDGHLSGRLDCRWNGTVPWVCLAGTAQIAICWLLLYQETGHVPFLDAARRANAFVRRTVAVGGPSHRVGGVTGSMPVSGGYGPFQYLNWACKFMIDANALELKMVANTRNRAKASRRAAS